MKKIYKILAANQTIINVTIEEPGSSIDGLYYVTECPHCFGKFRHFITTTAQNYYPDNPQIARALVNTICPHCNQDYLAHSVLQKKCYEF